MSYPATEGLQHIAHDQNTGLYHDDRTAYQRDGMQAYDKQALSYSQAPEHYEPVNGQLPKKRICGLSKKTFLIVLVVVLFVVLAGAVGGGVGGALAAKNGNKAADSTASQSSDTPLPVTSSSYVSVQSTLSSTSSGSTSSASPTSTSSTSTTSTTSLTSSASTPTTTAAALTVLGCPSANGTTYTPSGSTSSFLKYCQQDLQSSGSATVDIQSRIQDTFDDCINSCAEYTDSWIAGGRAGAGPCVGATFNALIPDWPYNNLRCFLKAENGGGPLKFTSQVLENVMASALLVT
ncbi:hypothetical protein DL95DRAFT_529797 [Leptodontidium sp. 2 PMI_412]|nr:hypothetical protein DL95DRAFT_529797 [Leptodontidium sp. 2 PMI_412]